MKSRYVPPLILASLVLALPARAAPSMKAPPVVARRARPAASFETPAQSRSDFDVDVGLHWFKLSAGKPAEVGSTAVFDRWESINASDQYAVHDYVALKPLYFNMVFGVDALIRFKRYLMLKIGYDVTHPFGIGGSGHIAYRDEQTGAEVKEEKSFSYTSHQVTSFIGPIVSVDRDQVDLYLGFSPMAPTWVLYQEHYQRTEDGQVTDETHRHYHGFFGSCRALIGMQVPVAGRFKLGSEAVFTFLDYMSLERDGHTDGSFRFPFMQWDFTARYALP